MSNEQTIYISPEDDLTTVRERLEHVESRNVTLVVPAQTQLRSHVAWKLLNARARELGKEVLIVSSDPQVRSVAHAVKFTVAHSLEAGQGHSKPASRPTRTSLNKNPRSGAPTPRSSTPREASSASTSRQHQQGSSQWQGSTARPAQRNSRTLRGKRDAHDASEFREQPEDYQTIHSDFAESQNEPGSSTFQVPPSPYRREQEIPYPYRSQPTIHPLEPEQIDDEPDILSEDYEHAQRIRREASHPDLPGMHSPDTPMPLDDNEESEQQVPRTNLPRHVQEASKSGNLDEDESGEEVPDILTPPLPEQRGHAFVEDFDSGEHRAATDSDEIEDAEDVADISVYPTSIIEPRVEYVDDDDILPPQSTSRLQPSSRPAAAKRGERTEGESRETQNRRSRTGYISPGKAAAANPWQESLENDDLLPVEEQPTHIQEREGMAYDTPSRSNREPRPVQLPLGAESVTDIREPRGASSRGIAQRPGAAERSISNRGTGSLTRSRRPQLSRPSQPFQAPPHTPPVGVSDELRRRSRQQSAPTGQRTQRGQLPSRGTAVSVGAAILVLVLLALLGYLIPNSTVVLTLASHAYTHTLNLSASTTPVNTANGSIQGRIIQQDFTRQGLEPVTGTKMVDTGLANGNVCFSNSSNNSITIPTGTILTTAGATATQFKTTAEMVVPPATTCNANSPAPETIQAVQPGESGNVLEGTITVIPSTSLDSIAQFNNTTASKLSGLKVTNPGSTTGGGRQQVNAISNTDLQNAKNDLHKQLQSNIDAWIKSLPNRGTAGKPAITDTLVNPPVAGTTTDNNAKNFQANVKVSVSILYVSDDDMKRAAVPQINTALKTDKNLSNYIVPGNYLQALQVRNVKVLSSTATSMKLSYTIVANVVSNIDTGRVRALSAGQSHTEAQHVINSAFPGIQKVDIITNPAFFPWVAFWQPHITVKTQLAR